MADTSRALSQSSENKVRSALVTAFEQWTTPFDIKPEGVFGSVATLACGDVTISSKTLDFEFYVPFDDDMEANEAEIIIYNLSDNTIKQLKCGAALSISAGYADDTGVLFNGYITKVKTVRDGADKITTIFAMDDVKEHPLESIAFAKGTTASYILQTLLSKTGLPIAVFNARRDHTYTDAQTVEGDLKECISQYAEVCGVSVYVNKGMIYARYIKEGDNLNFEVSSDTGMIGSPESYTEEVKVEDFEETVNGFEVEMILQHRMCAGAIVDLKSREATGTFRVCKGEHRFSPDEAITKIKMY